MMTEENNNGKVPFEVAIDKTGFGVYSFLITSLAGVVIIAFACVGYASTIIVPASACELGTTAAQQGLLASAPIIGTIIGAVVWGYLADTKGRRSMLLVSLLCGCTINAVASISVDWIMLLILQFIASLMASGQYTISMTLLSESVPMARRNLVVLLVTSIFLLSQGIMAVLAMPIIPLTFSYELPALGIFWNSWRTLMLVYCAPSLLCAVWLFFMQESPKFTLAKGDEAETLRILTVIYRMNNRKASEEFQVKGLVAEVKPQENASTMDKVVPLFKMPLLKYTVIMFTLSLFHQVTAFKVWLPTIANQYVSLLQTEEGSDMTLCGVINSELDPIIDPDATPCALNVTALLIVLAVGAIQSVFNLIMSMFVDRLGRRNTAMAITAFCGTCGILVNLVPNAIGSLILFGLFLLSMVCLGLYTAISVALFPTNLRALAVSLTMTGGRVGSFASIQILNFLLINNCEIGFYVYASIVASSAIVASFLPDDRLLRKQMLAKPVETPDTENSTKEE